MKTLYNFYESRHRYKTNGYSPAYLWRRVTTKLRRLPDYLIFGTQKCGTTSLYNYLVQHPNVESALKKEVKYFDLFANESIGWYRSHFCYTNSANLCGEATPDYIFFPSIARKIQASIPEVRLVAIFRDPVQRAYSHYRFSVRRGFEHLSFADAISSELQRMDNAAVEVRGNDQSLSENWQYRERSYWNRGLYGDQLSQWLRIFPREQFLFLTAKCLREDSKTTMRQVTDFLGIDPFQFRTDERFNASSAQKKISTRVEDELRARYMSDSQLFFSLSGLNPDDLWE